MAVYKVIQDIEADDKLLGPLTLKQFIFAAISCGFIFAAFMIATRVNVYGAIPLLPFIIVPAILAAPLSKDQPTDIWLAAQIRFWFKPRKRIWDQNGLKNLVSITAPIKLDHQYTDNLSQGEVRSRLKVLADTIDSRGWAAKNAGYATATAGSPQVYGANDRLVNPYMSTVMVAPEDLTVDSADIMDTNNPLAQKFDIMAKQAQQTNKSAAISQMSTTTQNPSQQKSVGQTQDAQDYYFMRQPDAAQIDPGSAMFNSAIIKPTGKSQTSGPAQTNQTNTADEQALLSRIKAQKQQALQQAEMTTPHHKIIKTPEQLAKEAKYKSPDATEDEQKPKQAQKSEQAQAVTPLKNPDIVNLSQDNDLSVATISGLANRKTKNTNIEGEIKLH